MQTGGAYTDAAKSISNLRMQFFDIDSQAGQNFSDFVGFDANLLGDVSNIAVSDDTNLLESFTSIGTDTTTYAAIALDPASAGNTSTWTDEINVPQNTDADLAAQVDYTMNVTFTSFSEGSFVAGTTGSRTVSVQRAFVISMSNPPVIVGVPEPSAAGVLAGGALLTMCLRRRKVA